MNLTISQRNNFMAPYLKAPVKQPDIATPDNTSAADTIKAQLDAYQKRCDESRQAIAQLRSSEQDGAQWKKADAAQKIQHLKDQIRMLRMMGGIGDPKSNLRQIAQLSKELAAAAREYASACSDISAASAPPSDTTAKTSDASEPSDTTDVPAGTTNVTDDTTQNANPQAELKAVTPAQESSVTEADRKFAAEVVNLANQLKALAKQQEMRLQQSEASATDGERAQMREAFAQIEKSVTAILTPAEAAPPSINIFA
ncbi:MAG TPA: hypothetical protein DE312_10690 [Gallionella sp.]|nr:MAG: hypothetical protein A2Z87_01240 [Gallionellales bacterium GWA2_54_124]OGT18069.1 MAG: hypothetical protein A2522_02525 [Gallionellales bacterium RIFOXYD12_FULL_53_10]HCI53762.1 hypothetical protein [Gallionella sp.]